MVTVTIEKYLDTWNDKN